MLQFGYKLMTEEHSPADIVRNAQRAEEAGFDFVAPSDHFHPWLYSHQHSGFVWSMLGAIAATTQRVGLVTAVTCPFVRYHPAVIAQAAATIALLSNGRFSLGLGSGERLNEHVVGQGWPSVTVRHEMLNEAIDIIRLLWQGGYHSFQGNHLTLEDARVFDLPTEPPPIMVAIGGPRATELAAQKGDGIFAVEPRPDFVEGFRSAGGQGPCYAEAPLAYAATEEEAVRTAWERFRFGIPGWKVAAELPNPINFEAATATVRESDVAEAMACGPDPERHVQVVSQFVDAGFDRVVLIGIGPDQDSFFDFWSNELQPRLRKLG